MSAFWGSRYKRKVPPFVVPCGMGIAIWIVRPVVWSLEKLGLTYRVIESVTARVPQPVAAKEPLEWSNIA